MTKTTHNHIISKHIQETQYRLIYWFVSFSFTFFTCYTYSTQIIYLFVRPFLALPKFASQGETSFIFTDLYEALYTTINVCWVSSLFLLAPSAIYHIYCFFVPSCFLFERAKIKKMLALTIIFCYLFVFLLVYFFVVPVFCGFLLGFGVDSAAVTIQLEARIHSYVTLTIKIFFVVFALVQIPICFFLLEAFGWLTAQTLFENRRFFLATLLVFSGFLAPPEIALQFVVFLSFYLSFEIMIWVMVYNSSNKSSYLL